MRELRYPNESQAYREARDALLKDEQELVEKTKAVAEKRRKLPAGGALKEDYVFQWAGGGKVGQRVKFSELFGDKDMLILYSWMFMERNAGRKVSGFRCAPSGLLRSSGQRRACERARGAHRSEHHGPVTTATSCAARNSHLRGRTPGRHAGVSHVPITAGGRHKRGE